MRRQQAVLEAGERFVLSLIRSWIAILETGREPEAFRHHFDELQQGLNALECPAAARAFDGFMEAIVQPGQRPVEVCCPGSRTVGGDESLLLSACAAIGNGNFRSARQVLAARLAPAHVPGALRNLAIFTAALEARGYALPARERPGPHDIPYPGAPEPARPTVH
ncbi:MAG: hypothetical protein ACLFWF_01465 [Alphaproteobacteria bacterium]